MFAGGSLRGSGYTAAIIVVGFGIALPLWKSRNSAKPDKPSSSDTKAKAKIVRKQSSSDLEGIPALLPGDTCEKAERALGKPIEEDEYSRTWETQSFTITATTDPDCHLTAIAVSVQAGRKARTVDGITLGGSTLAEAEKILEKSLTERSESVEAAEGHWLGTLQSGPTPGMPFRATYSAYLESDKEEAIGHDPLISDFRRLPITQYSLEMIAPHN